ncbi:hypothetical protein [Plantactinospora sp. DSM 117369]
MISNSHRRPSATTTSVAIEIIAAEAVPGRAGLPYGDDHDVLLSTRRNGPDSPGPTMTIVDATAGTADATAGTDAFAGTPIPLAETGDPRSREGWTNS